MMRNLQKHWAWAAVVVLLAAVCVFLAVLLGQQDKVRHNLENENQSLTSQLDSQVLRLDNLTVEYNELDQQADELRSQLSDAQYLTSHAVLTLDRYLPFDLVDTVLTYYKAKSDCDYETFQTVIAPEGNPEHAHMLKAFDYNRGPGLYDNLSSVVLLDASSHDDLTQIMKPSFEGTAALTVSGSDFGEILYLRRQDGHWFVESFD